MRVDLRKRVKFFLLLLPALTTTVASAQISSENSDPYSIIGSRAGALADAYVADDYDAMVMYWNPAALVKSSHQFFSANAALEINEFDDKFMTENVTLPLPPLRGWGFGLGITMTQDAGISFTSPLVGLDISVVKFDVAVGRAIDEALSVGGDITLRYGKGGGKNATALEGTFGLYYAPNRVFSYGVSLQGVGSGIDFTAEDGQTILKAAPMLRSMQSGLTVRSFYREMRLVTMTMSVQKVFTHTDLVYKGGLEVLPVPFFALRIGYWVGPDSRAARYGAGLMLGDLVIDYSVAPSRFQPRFHQVSISYNLQPHPVVP
jgi:hypothetical protein